MEVKLFDDSTPDGSVMTGVDLLHGFVAVIVGVVLLDVVTEAIGGPVAFAVSHVFSWLGFLINVSILTTLYGHLFQDRSLD